MNAKWFSARLSELLITFLATAVCVALTASAQEKPLKVTTPKKAKKELLDGKKFVGQFVEKGKKTETPDTLVFSKGKFRSKACRVYGFRKAKYTASTKNDQIVFSAEAKSKKEGTMAWNGTVRGDALEATAMWAKPESKSPVEYTFKGTLKKKKK